MLHQFNEDKIYLLLGDGVIADDETVEVPVMDKSRSPFTGAFVLDAKHAWEVVKAFVRSGSIETLGEWQEL